MKKSHRAPFAVSLVGVGLLLISVALLETAFFHLNPIKLGFREYDLGRFKMLSKSLVPEGDYGTISESMSRNEAAVAMRFKSKVQIILLERQSDVDRYQPFASAADRRNSTAFAPWPNTIYVTPKAKEKYGTLEGTVAHELSHVLLIQNYGVIKMAALWKQAEWIPEGFATYLNNWPDYFTRAELPEEMKKVGITIEADSFPPSGQLSKLSLPLRYTIYRYFVEYLYQRAPSSTIVQFLKDACNSPGKTRALFMKAFGDSIDRYWKAFRMDLNKQ